MRMRHNAVYGSVVLERAFCTACDCWSIVQDNKHLCCDKRRVIPPKNYKRMVESTSGRKKPGAKDRRKILQEQGNCCLYCTLPFGSKVLRGTKVVKLQLHWDHLVPYSYSQNNLGSNFVAACHVCNNIKSDKCFNSLEEAKQFIIQKRLAKGYDT